MGDKPKRVRKDITFNLIPIKSYIELVVYTDGHRVSSTKFIFTIITYVDVKYLTVHFSKGDIKYGNNEVEDMLKQNYDSKVNKEIGIGNMLFRIRLEFSRLKIGSIQENISPSIQIGEKEVQVKKFSFSA
jgi:hypothetical protein